MRRCIVLRLKCDILLSIEIAPQHHCHTFNMLITSFLKDLRPVKPLNVIKFVTGNQSADMDSVVCAITYSFFYAQTFPHEQPFLPLINISKDELKLRRDIVLLLKSHSISEDDIFFLEDVLEFTKLSSTQLEVVLVDHCNLQGELLTKLYEQKRLNVSGIIDHHEDEQVFKDAAPRVIRPNGSCTSLVFNYWYDQLKGKISAEPVLLLLGPLLIDTANMTQKVEQGDVDAFSHYQQIFDKTSASLETTLAVPGSFSVESFYSNLKAAKKNMEGFSLYDILRKDYKQFTFVSASGKKASIGFSSVGKGMVWLTKNFSAEEFARSYTNMLASFNLDVIVMTTSFTRKDTGQHAREFCYYSTDQEFKDLAKYATALKLDNDLFLDDTTLDVINSVNEKNIFHVYNQANVAATRKQVVPVVKSIIEEGNLI